MMDAALQRQCNAIAARGEIAAYERDNERLAVATVADLKSRLRPTLEATPAGYSCGVNLLQRLPRRRHGDLLRAMYEVEAHPWTFQVVLVLSWRWGGGCRVVAAAAGSRDELRAWFSYARIDWPCDGIFAECMTTYTARDVTLYRGGRGDPARLAGEFSWTPLKPIAAIYGCGNADPHPESDGPPVVVRRVVQRAHIAAAFLVGDQEHIVLHDGPWEIETTDPDELASLFAEGREMQKQHREDRAEFEQRWQRFLAGLPRG